MNTMTNAAAPGDGKAPAPEKADRDIPQLRTKRKTSTVFRLVIIGTMLLMIVLLAVGAAMFMKRLQVRKQEQTAEQAKARPVPASYTSTDFESMKKRIKREEAAEHPVLDAATQLPPPAAAMAQEGAGGTNAGFAGAKNGGWAGSGGGGSQAPAPKPETPMQRRMGGDVVVATDEASAPAGQQPPTAAATPQLPLSGLPGAASRQSALEEQLKPSKLEAVAAVRRRDLNLLLPAGTSIPCGQHTYIVSTNPGQAKCVVSKDVYSANGVTLLIERGSQVLGERMQPLQLGQEMMPVLWDRIDTPRGVSIDIASLATDSLGASGLPVYIDDHWGKRFGAAIMLSLISDLGQAAANAAGNGGGTIRLATTAGAGQELASKALDKTINIPPTGYSLQGSAINIFVARDADFGRVYELARY
jgi:type IV secretion system protein VirB10